VLFNCVQGTVLRFLPPLILTRAQVDEGMSVLEAVMVERFVRRAAPGIIAASVA
jgi:acetylornithine/succinyldiaminopimelate/putrescine aminotransferase